MNVLIKNGFILFDCYIKKYFWLKCNLRLIQNKVAAALFL